MPDELVSHLIQIGVGTIMLWVVKTVQDATVELKAFRVTLFGDTGRNGINGDVKRLRDDVEVMKEHIAGIYANVEVLKSRMAT